MCVFFLFQRDNGGNKTATEYFKKEKREREKRWVIIIIKNETIAYIHTHRYKWLEREEYQVFVFFS